MKKNLSFLFLSLSLVLLGACSQHTREVDGVVDPQIILENLDETLGANTAAGGSTSRTEEVKAMMEDPNVSIYYSEGPSELGPIESVFSFVDFAFLKVENLFDFRDLKSGRVFFIDLKTEKGRKNAIIMDMVSTDDSQVIAIYMNYGDGYFDQPVVNENEYVTVVSTEAGEQTLMLRTFDIEKGTDDLMANIQLKVSAIVDGQEKPIGRFSTLMGFGQ